MKRRCCVVLITLVIMLGIAGCHNTEQPSNAQTETLLTPAPSKYTESALGNLHIELATDELLNKYDLYHEHINDEAGARLIITTDTEIKDFAFISIKSEDTGNKLCYFAGNTLFSVDEMSPQKPFVVKLLFPGSLPSYGISFVDENGVQRYFAINLSGRDPEEAPPYFLLEFENGGDFLSTAP